jgi:hypothetical protein
MDTCSLSLKANSYGLIGLRLTIRFDNLVIFDSRLTNIPITVEHEFVDNQPHVLEIIMSGKEPADTVLDDKGQILEDRLIDIEDIMLDDIDITTVFCRQATYTHDFNGSQPQVVDKFYNIMGCNGTVRLEFANPVYNWLLENIQ